MLLWILLVGLGLELGYFALLDFMIWLSDAPIRQERRRRNHPRGI